MILLVQREGRRLAWGLALALGFGVGSSGTVRAGEYAPGPYGGPPSKLGIGWLCNPDMGCGTLGYGPPGLFRGFYGFGNGFHLGYGYGGYALGVGATDGDPWYGGPGYPHPEPPLNRFGRILPFTTALGSGGPTPANPNFYQAMAGLSIDKPVARVTDQPGVDQVYPGDFGPNTGAVPYPEQVFAPFAARAAATGSATGQPTPAPPPEVPNTPEGVGLAVPPSQVYPGRRAPAGTPTQARELGFDQEPATTPAGLRGMQVTRVDEGSLAQKAGLRVGDLIISINGYLTDEPGNLPWIIINKADDRLLRLNVRSPGEAQDKELKLELP